MIILQLSTEAKTIENKGVSYFEKISAVALDYAPKVIGAIVLYIIGSWLLGKVIAIMQKMLMRKNYDASLQSFLLSLVKVVLNILLLISIAGMLGVDTTAFSALIVGAGVAIGSALNGTLGNFAGGVMMLIFKPFKVGDMIEAQGIVGEVIEQGVFNTTLLTADNKTVYIPNGPLSTGVIANYSSHGNLRVDIVLEIDGGENIDKAREIAIKALHLNEKVLKDPMPNIHVQKVSDGNVIFSVQVYCLQPDYWHVYYHCTEAVKKAWNEHGVKAPDKNFVLMKP